LAILVTGGAGYIGSHAARALRRAGYDVVLYDDLSTGHRCLAEGLELIEGDIADLATLRPALRRATAIMHFAAHAYVGESVTHPRKYFANNAAAGLALLNAALDAGIQRFVFSSTCAVYGLPHRVPITEDAPRQPVNPYGASKLLLEHALEAYDQAYGMRSARLRYFNAAGADESGEIGELHEPETHLIPLALSATSEHSPPLQVYGNDYPTADGTCIRDYIHVADLSAAHLLAVEAIQPGRHEVYNLGNGEGYSNQQVIEAVREVTGHAVPVKLAPRRAGDAAVTVAASGKAHRELGWRPARTDLREIISDAWAFHRANVA
jgi:UDP-glucose 4-epimerase